MSAKPVIEYRFESEISLPYTSEKPPMIGLADVERNLAIPSPASALQARLKAQFDIRDIPDRWSPRRSAAFILLSCGSFWAALLSGLIFLL